MMLERRKDEDENGTPGVGMPFYFFVVYVYIYYSQYSGPKPHSPTNHLQNLL